MHCDTALLLLKAPPQGALGPGDQVLTNTNRTAPLSASPSECSVTMCFIVTEPDDNSVSHMDSKARLTEEEQLTRLRTERTLQIGNIKNKKDSAPIFNM